TVHFQYGYSTIKLLAVMPGGAQFGPPGYEMNLLYIIGLLVLVLGGSGRFSVDNLLLSKFKPLHRSGSQPITPPASAGKPVRLYCSKSKVDNDVSLRAGTTD